MNKANMGLRNEGHGHVTPRPDGYRSRCGGPAMCVVCQRERAALEATQPPQDERGQGLSDEQILAGVKEFADENYYVNYKDDILRCVRTLLAASAPAQQRKTLESMAAESALEQDPALAATPQPVAAEGATTLLAKEHKGMRVDYSGLLGQCQRGLRRSGEHANSEMLRQLQGHLKELGQRWYSGDTAVVDEILQLYCIEREARALAGTGSDESKKGDGNG